MEQMLANGIQLIKTDASYVFSGDTVFYRNEIPFKNQSNDFDITDCYLAQPIDFTDLSVLQFLSVETSVSCDVLDYLGNVLTTIAAVNVGTYDTQNVFNLEIDWSTITGNLERCYLQITDGTEYFKSEPLRMINLKQRIKLRYRMLRNHKSIGYFFNPSDEFYQFFHIFYVEASITEFKREITKSVFEDSNQTLLNLFGTFRHSFLLKTFQVGYYMHEKIVTLSLCDTILLSEIRNGIEYEGRIFLSKDETPEEELISETNLYVSSARFVVDKAFRLVGAAQETPVIDPGTEAQGIVPIHHTNPNGKKATFQTPYDLLPGKTLYTPQGNPNEYLFKIGGITDNFRNSHDAAWVGETSLTFAEFSLLEVPAGSHVLITYTGDLEQSNIVSTLYSSISDTPINPSTRTVKPNQKTAISDLLIYPKLITGFDSVGVSTGSVNLFSQQRTFSDLTNNEVISFNNGITNLPITTEDGIGHLHLEPRGTTPLTVNITTNQANPLREIIAYASPTNNEFYPTSPDGTNPPVLGFDRVNDTAFSTSQDVVDFMNIWTQAPGEVRTIAVRFLKAGGDLFRASTNGGFFLNPTRIDYRSTAGGVFQAFFSGFLPANQVVTMIVEMTRPAVFAGAISNFVKVWTNGKKIPDSGVIGINSLAGDPMTANIGIGSGFIAATIPNITNREYIAFFNRSLTESEIDQITLGTKDAAFDLNPQYAWDYGQIVNTNEILHVGILTAPNLVIGGGAFMENLFIP